MSGDSLREALQWADEHCGGLDVAADCEARVQTAYEPEMERWAARSSNDPQDNLLMRMVRNNLEARSNEKRYRKEAAHIRALVAAIRSTLTDANGEPCNDESGPHD